MLAALSLSETLIAELVNADQVLICTPMYNYSIPAVLKSWIDYLVRPGFTGAPRLLVSTRAAVCIELLGELETLRSRLRLDCPRIRFESHT